MDKYIKYNGMILRVIPGAVFHDGKSIGTVSLENKNNYYIINVVDILPLTYEELVSCEVLDS